MVSRGETKREAETGENPNKRLTATQATVYSSSQPAHKVVGPGS